jgi:hypothetical protein
MFKVEKLIEKRIEQPHVQHARIKRIWQLIRTCERTAMRLRVDHPNDLVRVHEARP